MSFYGLTMRPYFAYTQRVTRAFHISSVALDVGGFARLCISVKGVKYTVATLTRRAPQFALDLSFSRGDSIVLQSVGDATICLMGNSVEEESPRAESTSDISSGSTSDDSRILVSAETNAKKEQHHWFKDENNGDDADDDAAGDDFNELSSNNDKPHNADYDRIVVVDVANLPPPLAKKSKMPSMTENQKLVHNVIVAVLKNDNNMGVQFIGKRRHSWPADGVLANRPASDNQFFGSKANLKTTL